jgi:hypothetical protein
MQQSYFHVPSVKRNGPNAGWRTEAACVGTSTGEAIGGDLFQPGSCTRVSEFKLPTRELFRPNLKSHGSKQNGLSAGASGAA